MIRLAVLVMVTALVGCSRQAPTSSPTPASSPATASSPTTQTSQPVVLDLSAGLTDEDLRPHVGRRITVTGFWRVAGKPSIEIYGGLGSSAVRVYLARWVESFRGSSQGARVEVTGTLRYVPWPEPTRAGVVATQPVTPGFYIDAADAEVRKPAAPTSQPVTLDLITGLTKDSDLMPYVDHRVRVIGLWGGLGKPGLWIYGGEENRVVEIYLRLLPGSEKPLANGLYRSGFEHGVQLEVTGTLRYLAPPPPSPPSDPRFATTQPVTPGFYFDVEEFHKR